MRVGELSKILERGRDAKILKRGASWVKGWAPSKGGELEPPYELYNQFLLLKNYRS